MICPKFCYYRDNRKVKGIEVTFGCNVAIAQNVIDSVGMEKDEIELITTPINHSLAIRRSYGAIYNGSSIVLTDGIKFVEDFFKLLDRYKLQQLLLYLQYLSRF